ncbi:hypothetical protein ACQ4PT_060233 [Festuca glaucescens]
MEAHLVSLLVKWFRGLRPNTLYRVNLMRAGFNNFEAGGPSGTAAGAGLGPAGNFGYQGGNGFFQNGPAFNGNGGGYQSNNNGGYNGGNGAYQADQQVVAGAVGVQQRGAIVAPGASGVPASQSGLQVQEGVANPSADYIPLEDKGEDAVATQAKKQKNPAKLKCHRCGIVGHFVNDCVTELCNNCELPGHPDEECPLLSAPKPHMIMYGIGEECLCFFELPCTKSYKPKMENSRMGMLSVSGGEMSIPRIVAQLQRLVHLEQFRWDVRQAGQNVYKVAFPSKAELDRMKVFGTFHVPDSDIVFKFDSWSAKIEPNCLLPEVWLRVSGLPPRRKGDFLAVWGLGTLFGKTLQVDMKYTRQHGVARLRIGCLDYTCISQSMNIFIVDGFYDLTFEVEVPEGDDAEMQEASVDEGDGPNDDDQNEGDASDKHKKIEKQDVVQNTEIEKASTEEPTKASDNVKPTAGSQVAQKFGSGVKFSPAVQKMIEQSRRLLVEACPIKSSFHES